MTPKPPSPAAKIAFPLWKKIMIASGLALVTGGAGLKINAVAQRSRREAAAVQHSAGGEKVDRAANPAPEMAGSLVAGRGDPSGTEGSSLPEGFPPERRGGKGASGPAENGDPSLSEQVSPFMLHGGISFFVGLAIGYATRAFFRMFLVGAGAILLCVFGLSYAGIVKLDKDSLDEWAGKMKVKIESAEKESEGFRDFVLTSLPSAGLAGAGLVTGFKRR